MAIKKTQMYRKNLDTSETNLYPLTESQYVLMENGQTVQEVLSDRDSDKYTPVITNSSSTFKVGQGDNVDLSSSMKEGAYDSCVLKGKTMVNCIQEPSSKDVVLPYEFADGRYVTINDTKESGALGVELKGQTLVNLLNFNKIIANATTHSKDGGKITVSSISERAWASLDIFIEPLKPNTDYILMIDNVSFTHSDNFISTVSVYCRDGNVKLGQLPSQSSNFFKFNTADKDLSLITLRIHATLGSANSATTVVNGLRVLEYQQGMENWDIPYFEGMTSCKMPILSTIGKNLFDKNNYNEICGSRFYSNIVGGEKVATEVGDLNHRWVRLKLPVGKTYAMELDKRKTHPSGWTNAVVESDVDEIKVGATYRTIAYSINSTTNVSQHIFTTTKPYVFIHVGYGAEYIQYKQELLDSVMLNVGSSVLTYESHKSSILSLPEEVVLRSLPNGVCDTFNTRTGVYTQNVKEVTFNGSENWIKGVRSDTTVVSMFYLQLEDLLTNAEGDINDLFIDKIFTSQSHVIWDKDVEGIHNKRSCLYININNSRMSDVTIEAFKTWLSQNSITVQYQLVEPIITKINLPSTLKSWNTTTHIYSEIPENTLYPILSHSNPSYPVILKPSTKYSIVANSYSNNHTNSTINFNLGGATASTTVGNRVTTITTPSTLSNELLTMSGRGNKLNNVMVIEGDVVGDEPYFEGICDCKSPILSNVGKNLLRVNDFIASQNGLTVVGDSKTNTITVNGTCSSDVYFYSTNPRHRLYYIENGFYSGSYTTSLTTTGVANTSNSIRGHVGHFAIRHEESGRTPCTMHFSQKSMTFTFDKFLPNGCWLRLDKGVVFDNYVIRIQFEANTSSTPYEPHKTNTTTFNQKDDKTIVLRSLPNGVCDTLNVETGEYVQRIGEVNTKSLQTTVNLSIGAEANVVFVNGINGKFIGWNECNVASDKLQWTYRADINWSKSSSINGIAVEPNGGFWFIVDKTIETKEQANEFLVNLDATIQYELTTPIVSTIDVQGFPYAYTNGHVQLSSGSIEQSLTPKVEYSLSANKTGQINSNTKRVSAHQKQLDDFEAMMLTSMVQSAYDKAILQFDYEMQMMSLGGE